MEKLKGLKVNDLYNHIIKFMSPEDALKRLLESSLITYEKLKFPEGEQEVHPLIIMSLATMDMGWNFLVKSGDKDSNINGLSVGTEEYLNNINFKSNKQ